MKSKKLICMLLMLVMVIGMLPLTTGASGTTPALNYGQYVLSATDENIPPESGALLGITTSNGNVNSVQFTDADSKKIEGLSAELIGNNIAVSLPHNYPQNGKITAEFNLTQSGELPFITTKTGTSGTSSGRAVNNKFTKKTITLSGGLTVFTFYLYDSVPTNRNNNYTTYTISYSLKNEPPILSDGQERSSTDELVAGTAYSLDLSDIFFDPDGDSLSYIVKINGEAAVKADKNYSFVPSLGGTYTLEFFAKDTIATSEESYTVTLTVKNSEVTYDTNVLIPEGITPLFYVTNGFENNLDILGDTLESEQGESTNGFVPFTVKVPENVETISVRAQKSDVFLGGMSIPVSENSSVSFREVHVFIPTQSNEKYVTSEQALIEVSARDGHFAVSGLANTDDDGILYYPLFLAATGNNGLYTIFAKPAGDIASIYATTQANNKAIPADKAEIYETSVELSYKSAFMLNVPSDAEAKAFYQNKNYNVTELTPLEIKGELDGTKTYYFHVSSRSDSYSYRVSSEGKITKAGYISGKEKKISWSNEDYAPNAKIEYDKTSTLGSRGDDSLLLNVNGQQRLILSKDESFKLRAYRIWQIINNDSANKMIEPDFTFNIFSGSDVISVTPVTSGNGNAKNNWLNITAIGEGTAILEIGYDAIDIVSGNVTGFNAISQFTFSACDESRKGLVVVQTANAANDVDFGIKSISKWDAEFDTLYFTGEYATLDFTPTVASGKISKVEFSNDKGETWTEITKRDGIYTARIISGNNILKVTKDDNTSSYQVVRGDKISISVSDANYPGKTLASGATARITLDGVHFPMGKMSGIYNPGYAHGHKVTYTMGETKVQNTGTFQYNFPTNAYVDITIPDDAKPGDTIKLTGGYIYFNNKGSAAGYHRSIADSGLPSNMSASDSYHSRSILPDVTINLEVEDADSENDGDNGSSGDIENSENTEGAITRPNDSIDTSNLKFDISDSEIKGYVSISFTDNAKRKPGESGVAYKNALGEIIKKVRVPFKSRDTIASVTLRLLKALNIEAGFTGNTTSNFYLLTIGNFTLNGKYYSSFGEYSAGAASGWMVKHNNWFINMGASEFQVEDGDNVEWLYTCHLGADIGCDWTNPSAEISRIKWGSNYGTLSPAFKKDVTQYTYAVSSSVNSVRLQAEPENYWSKISYKSDDKTYKAMEDIPVSDGSVITIESSFARYAGDAPSDTDKIIITIKKSSGGSNGASGYINKPTKQEENESEKTSKDDEVNEMCFADVKKNEWHYEAVKYVYERKLMNGTENGFEPESKMSRAMLVTVLYRMVNPVNIETNHIFTDVPNGQWYSDAIAWAASRGIVSGITETKFAPDEDISREQMALIIYRFAKAQGYDVSDKADISSYADSKDISDWALDALGWANKKELINGTSQTLLSPNATATRAQVAAILMRFCENIVK